MLATVTAHIQYTVKAYPLSISDYEPQSICEHLQYLFALLQNSNRKYIDPSGLVKALGLDTGQQQVHSVPFIYASKEPGKMISQYLLRQSEVLCCTLLLFQSSLCT